MRNSLYSQKIIIMAYSAAIGGNYGRSPRENGRK